MKPPAERIARWEELKGRYHEPRAALLQVLHEVQDELGWLSDEALEWVAGFFDLAPVDVLATASFYWMFRLEPPARHRIAVCRNLSCDLRGKDEVLRAIADVTGLHAGHGAAATPDGLFSLRLVECMGACTAAPMMDIDGVYHENLDYERTVAILAGLRDGKGAK